MTQRLELRSISAALRERERVFRVQIDSLTLQQGECVTLIGASGSGKTLLLEMIALLVRPEPGGAYLIEEFTSGVEPRMSISVHELWKTGRADLNALRGRFFGFVLQSGGLLPFLTVRESIALSQTLADRRDSGLVRRLTEVLELGTLADQHPARLSVGERQRATIACALAHRPAFVIADEPTSALDPERSQAVLRLLREAADSEGAGVVLSTHDMEIGNTFGDRRFGLSTARSTHGARRELHSTLRELVAGPT